jgi:aspartate aminotransferase-like enzyme
VTIASLPDEASRPAPAFGTFFLPGPTEVRREVLEAMTRPMIAHRGKAFEQLFARMQEGLRAVFRTTRPVFVSSSSATGLMEAAVRCAPPGPLLAIVNGAFSARFAHIGRACGRETDVMDVPWGEVPDLDGLRERLASRRYAAVAVVHSETSTGALTDVRAVQALAREHGALCLVDSVTGLAGAPLEFDAWDMDFVLTGSQKALALPPGLAFGVASEAYMRAARETPHRGLYFDLVEFEEYGAKHQTPNTPALPLLYAADVQLAHIAREGMEARWARHRAMAERTWRWVDEAREATGLALGVLAPAGSRATTVTAVTLPDGITGPQVAAAVKARGFVIGSGYGKVKDRTFRIGHMGDHVPEGLERCLAACMDALHSLARA